MCSEILCPECFKKKLIDKGNEADMYCDGCKTEFIKVGKNTVRYK
jgi:hypothetical protein